MPVTEESFGHLPDGREVKRFTLTGSSGQLIVQVINYGATITSIRAPDSDGNLDEVTLGFDDLQGYLHNDPYFGATIGRYANRIAKGRFTLDGGEYKLAVNNGPNHLHGGIVGFDKKLWSASVENDDVLSLTVTSADGDEGYPGQVDVTTVYRVTPDNHLLIGYTATATKPTPINLTNHAYFNLDGHARGNIFDHTIELKCHHYTPVDDTLIPTGEISRVDGTPYDLRQPTRLSKELLLEQVPGKSGFDNNFVVADYTEHVRQHAARVTGSSGRVMDVYTTQPGLQLYTAGGLNQKGRGGVVYKGFAALCLEAQNFPDAPNKPDFPNSILKPEERYEEAIEFAFSTTAESE